MKGINKVAFDELDIKFLNELPLISEILTSTSNKMTRVFRPIVTDISEFCINNVPKGWEIDKKKGENIFYPFTSDYGKDNITSLDNFFQLKNYIKFIKKIDKKLLNSFEIQYGFYYNEGDIEDNTKPYFYFFILRDPSEKFEGKMYPLSFYNNISEQFKDFKCKIDHPDKGDDYEYIEIEVEISNTDRIYDAYELFKAEVLTPFIQDIKE